MHRKILSAWTCDDTRPLPLQLNAHTRDVTVPNFMVLSFGGLAQLLAGMWEFATGNTFGATGEYRGNSPIDSFLVVQDRDGFHGPLGV